VVQLVNYSFVHLPAIEAVGGNRIRMS
jgi:hypothetical protein